MTGLFRGSRQFCPRHRRTACRNYSAVSIFSSIAGVSIKGERFLKDLARQTAGRAFFPYRESELAAVHDHIADDVRHRYLLSYTPTNKAADGTYRKVELDCVAYKPRNA